MRFFSLSIFFTFLLHSSTIAQGNGRAGGQAPSGRFFGRVIDAGNKGVQAASVTLVQNRMDSATRQMKEVIAGGMLTGNGGNFSIENVPAFGKYILRVTGIGYKPVEQNVAFQLPNRNGGGDPAAFMNALDKDLGNIKLEIDDKVLSNVTVTGSRPMVQMGIDRKIFNVEQNIVSAGGSAVDVLRNVPTISVDIDGNVSLRNSAPQIFVDGRPTNMTLEQIPADAIESIEVITNPSAKFDASGGTAGILNIVLKKNKRVGYSGNVRANIDSRARFGLGGNANMRQNKINLFAMSNFNQRRSIGKGTNERFDYRDTTLRSFQNDRSVMNGAFGFGRAGFDYFMDNRNTLTLSGSMARGSMSPTNNAGITVDSIFNGAVTGSRFNERSSNAENQFRNWGTQASFKHNFPKTGHEITADVTYNEGRNKSDNTINTSIYKLPGKTFLHNYTTLQRGSGTNNNLVLQTDYANPLTDKSKLELGARAFVRNMSNRTDYFFMDDNGSVIYNQEQSIHFTSRDHVYAAYANFMNRIKNFGYQLGLRLESSNYEGMLMTKNQPFKKEFPISLFPSLFLSQKLTDADEMQFNYSRRINRPNFWQLFPFYDLTDTLNISRGNPDLNPEFTNSLEMSYSKTFKNRDNFLASIYFKNTDDLITRIQVREEVDVLDKELPVLSYVNANRSYVSGLELTSRNKITKWWDVTSNINLFTSKIDLKDQQDPQQLTSYFLRFNNNFKLPKNFSIQISTDYNSKRLVVSSGGGGGGGRGGGGGGWFGGPNTSAQGYIRPQFEMDAAVRYDFLKEKRATISVNMNDVLKTRRYSAFTEAPGFVQDVYRVRDQQLVRVNFSWRFGKFDQNLFKRRNTRAENEPISEPVSF